MVDVAQLYNSCSDVHRITLSLVHSFFPALLDCTVMSNSFHDPNPFSDSAALPGSDRDVLMDSVLHVGQDATLTLGADSLSVSGRNVQMSFPYAPILT